MKPFKELSEDKKWDIVSTELSDNWYEDTYNQFTEEMENLGFSDIKISFSGFYSQGDGASFVGTLDFEEFFRAKYEEMDFPFNRSEWEEDDELADLMEILPDPHFFIRDLTKMGFFSADLIRNSSNYVHENSVGFDFTHEDYCQAEEGATEFSIEEGNCEFTKEEYDELTSFIIFIEKYLKEWKNDVCKKLHNRLEKEYEAMRLELLKQLNEENDEW